MYRLLIHWCLAVYLVHCWPQPRCKQQHILRNTPNQGILKGEPHLLQGIRLEARPADVRDWLAGPAAAAAIALAAAAAAAAGGPHEALAEADADRDVRCRRALRAVQVIGAQGFGNSV